MPKPNPKYIFILYEIFIKYLNYVIYLVYNYFNIIYDINFYWYKSDV